MTRAARLREPEVAARRVRAGEKPIAAAKGWDRWPQTAMAKRAKSRAIAS